MKPIIIKGLFPAEEPKNLRYVIENCRNLNVKEVGSGTRRIEAYLKECDYNDEIKRSIKKAVQSPETQVMVIHQQ